MESSVHLSDRNKGWNLSQWLPGKRQEYTLARPPVHHRTHTHPIVVVVVVVKLITVIQYTVPKCNYFTVRCIIFFICI